MSGKGKASMAERDLSAVAPDLRAALALLPDFTDLGGRLQEVRAAMRVEPQRPGSDGQVELRELAIARPDGSMLRALLHLPIARIDGSLPALLHVHGGGMVCGSADRDEAIARATALEFACAVVTPDYRLAPECPYPAPLDDVVLAWEWLATEGRHVGIDPARAVLRGISAGGGLALGAAIRLRTRGAVMPRLIVLVAPMLDDRTDAQPHAGALVWTYENNRFGWDSYLAGTDRANPPAEAVPARARDLGGLPPVFLATGTLDLFADENLEIVRRLAQSGNAVECHLYPGAYHGFHAVPSRAASACQAAAGAALRLAMDRAPTGT